MLFFFFHDYRLFLKSRLIEVSLPSVSECVCACVSTHMCIANVFILSFLRDIFHCE